MSTLAEKNFQKGWDFVFDKLYYPKNHMIYDFLYGESIEETIDFYPNAEEIKNSIPNPCGWGTGMEDSTLNLCTMLEAIENRYKATRDTELKKYFGTIKAIREADVETLAAVIPRSAAEADYRHFHESHESNEK